MARGSATSARGRAARALLAAGLAALLAGGGARAQDAGGGAARLRVLVRDGGEARLRVLRPGAGGTLAELLAELGAPPGSYEALQYRLPDAGAPEQWVAVKDDVDAATMVAEFEAAAAEAGGASPRFEVRLGSGAGGAEQVPDGPKAGAFADWQALRDAVMSCLAEVPTGKDCCQSERVDCGAAGTTEMPDWDVSQVTDMSYLFVQEDTDGVTLGWGHRAFNQDLSRWNTSAATDMSYMFAGATAFNSDISRWDTSAVTRMFDMFGGAEAFNGDLSNWNTSAVTDMSYMFDGATSFNGDISSWDTSAVTSMMMMFTKAYAFNQDISNWDVMAVTDNGSIFGPERGDKPSLREENSPCTATGVGADGTTPWRKCGRTRPLATEADIVDEADAIEPAAAAAADDRAGTAAGVWEGADGATWEDDGWLEDQLMSVFYTGPIPRRP